MFQQPSLLEKLFGFILKPQMLLDVPKNPWYLKMYDSIRLFCFFALFSILGIIINVIVTPFLGEEVKNVLDNQEPLGIIGILLLFLFLVIIAPLTEEIAFRQWLRPTPLNLSFGLVFLTFFTYLLLSDFIPFGIGTFLNNIFDTLITFAGLHVEDDEVIGFLIIALFRVIFLIGAYIFIFVFSILGLYLVLKLNKTILKSVQNFFQKYFAFLFYFSAVYFGLIHITNYTGIENAIWLAPLLVLPQLFGGLELGYVRVHYGLWWAIFNHALNNFIPFIVLASVSLLSEEAMSEETLESFTPQDTLVLLFLGLFILFVLFVIVFVNILNIIELVVSLSKKRKQKQQVVIAGEIPQNSNFQIANNSNLPSNHPSTQADN